MNTSVQHNGTTDVTPATDSPRFVTASMRATHTTTACPPWCTLPEGHGYEVEADLGGADAVSREHICRVAEWDLNSVRITADGETEWNGAPETVSPLRIDVTFDPPNDRTSYLDGLTARDTRQLAAGLIAAADLLEAQQ